MHTLIDCCYDSQVSLSRVLSMDISVPENVNKPKADNIKNNWFQIPILRMKCTPVEAPIIQFHRNCQRRKQVLASVMSDLTVSRNVPIEGILQLIKREFMAFLTIVLIVKISHQQY